MKPLMTIKNLLKSMSVPEIKIVRKLLHSVDESPEDLKTYRLLEEILNNPQLHEQELMKIIYPKGVTLNSFRMLCDLLLKKISESLILNVNIARKNLFSPYWKTFLYIKKNIIISHTWRTKGLYREVMELYDYMLNKAKKYEFYNEIVEILWLKKTASLFLHDKKTYSKIDEEINHFENCRLAKHEVVSWYSQLDKSEVTEQPDYLNRLENAINEFDKKVKFTYSDSISYYLYNLKIDYYQKKRNYDDAYRAVKKLLKLVKKPSLNLLSWKASAYLQMSEIELFRYNFKRAAKAAHTAKKNFTTNIMNYSYACEWEFYALFYQGHFQEAENLLCELLDNPQFSASEFMDNKRKFLLGWVLLLRGDIKEAAVNINLEKKELSNKGMEWKIAIRLQAIMFYIESRDYDRANNSIMNLYLQIFRNEESARKRYHVITKLLKKLMSTEYNFEKVWRQHKQDFDLLQSAIPDYTWTIKSPELLAFHHWVKSKVFDRPYFFYLKK